VVSKHQCVWAGQRGAFAVISYCEFAACASLVLREMAKGYKFEVPDDLPSVNNFREILPSADI